MTQKRVLVVEDEPITAVDVQETLVSLGHVVTGAVFTGEEAVRRVGEDRPDLVLMDIKLFGRMDGIQAARTIRDLYDIPVVFVTAYGDKELSTSSEITVPKGYGYIVKPFTRDELARSIERAFVAQAQDRRN